MEAGILRDFPKIRKSLVESERDFSRASLFVDMSRSWAYPDLEGKNADCLSRLAKEGSYPDENELWHNNILNELPGYIHLVDWHHDFG